MRPGVGFARARRAVLPARRFTVSPPTIALNEVWFGRGSPGGVAVASMAQAAMSEPATILLPSDAERFAAFQEAWGRAAVRLGRIERDFIIGGHRLRIELAGPALEPLLTDAFAHLAADCPGEPELTVRAWDSVSAGEPLPPGMGSINDYGRAARTGFLPEGTIRASFQRADFGLSVMDPGARLAGYWIPDGVGFTPLPQLPFYGRASPLRAILSWWTAGYGMQLAHAAAVATEAGGALLTGTGGSGKSTSAVACLLAGMDFGGDDYVLLEPGPRPFVHSLYSSAKLGGEDSPLRLPFEPDACEFDKGIYMLHRRFPKQTVAGFPIRAVVAPKVTGVARPVYRRISPAAALTALAPTSLLQLPGAGAAALAAFRAVVSAVPCYALEMGGGTSGVPAAIAAIIDGAAREGRG